MSEQTRFGAFQSMATLVLAVACSHGTATNASGENMLSAISDAEQENDRYAGACNAASSMTNMLAELSQHENSMNGILARMDDAEARMRMGAMMSMQCSGPSFDAMSTSLSEMHTEMASYAERLREATSIDDARNECSAHTEATGEMMHSMHEDVDAMLCMRM